MARPKSLAIDFKKAVSNIQAEYQSETKHITFIDWSKMHDRQAFNEWVDQAPPQLHSFYINGVGFELDKELFKKLLKSTQCLALPDPTSNRAMLLMSNLESLDNLIGNDEKKFTLFAFYHEAGHLIIPGANWNNTDSSKLNRHMNTQEKNRHECLADTFAAIHGLQKGFLSLKDIKQLSLSRALSDTEHTTTYVLDRLIDEAPKINFEKLTPQQIIDMTIELVDKHQMSGYNLEKITDAFAAVAYRTDNALQYDLDHQLFKIPKGKTLEDTQKYWQLYLYNMSKAVQEEKNNPAFAYIAERIFRAVENTGSIHFPNKVKIKRDGFHWQHVQDTLADLEKEQKQSAKTKKNTCNPFQ